jgi:hypothetical protein
MLPETFLVPTNSYSTNSYLALMSAPKHDRTIFLGTSRRLRVRQRAPESVVCPQLGCAKQRSQFALFHAHRDKLLLRQVRSLIALIVSWPAPSQPSLNNSTEYLPSISDTMPLPDSAVAADSLCDAPGYVNSG